MEEEEKGWEDRPQKRRGPAINFMGGRFGNGKWRAEKIGEGGK